MSEPRPILVVEDDEAIRTGLVDVLETEGYPVLAAAHGEEALALLRSAPLPSLILLDLMMPVMDGFEFLAHKQRDPRLADVPVVVLTAGRQQKVVAPAVQNVLAKPVKLTALLDAVSPWAPPPITT